MFCDSLSDIALSKNNVYHKRIKHVDVKFNKTRQGIADRLVEMLKISMLNNPAYIFTKILPVCKFQTALNLLRNV